MNISTFAGSYDSGASGREVVQVQVLFRAHRGLHFHEARNPDQSKLAGVLLCEGTSCLQPTGEPFVGSHNELHLRDYIVHLSATVWILTNAMQFLLATCTHFGVTLFRVTYCSVRWIQKATPELDPQGGKIRQSPTLLKSGSLFEAVSRLTSKVTASESAHSSPPAIGRCRFRSQDSHRRGLRYGPRQPPPRSPE